jgi:hypothetical protein
MWCSRSFLCNVPLDSHVKVEGRIDRTGAGEWADGAGQSGLPAPGDGADVLGIHIRSLFVWRLWRTEEMSDDRNVGMLECRIGEMMECWKCWSVRILECWNVGMLECWSVGIWECWNEAGRGGMPSRAISCAFQSFGY